MFKFLQLNPKYKSILVRVISSLIFALLFILIAVGFEFLYRGSVVNQINKLIHEILLFGI
jgi:uncharacterized membrane protein YGL010W